MTERENKRITLTLTILGHTTRLFVCEITAANRNRTAAKGGEEGTRHTVSSTSLITSLITEYFLSPCSQQDKREKERGAFSALFPTQHTQRVERSTIEHEHNTLYSFRQRHRQQRTIPPLQSPMSNSFFFTLAVTCIIREREENVGGGFPLSRLFTSSENNNRETRSLRNVVSLTLCPFPFLFVCHSLLFSLSVLCHLFCYWGNYLLNYLSIPLSRFTQV